MKKVIVTGGSRGIGRATVTYLVQHGFEVAFTYNKQEQISHVLVDAIRKRGGLVSCYHCDVSNPLETEEVMHRATEEMGGVDALVCNAGMAHQGLLQDMSWGQWLEVMNVNLNSLFYCTKPLIPYLIDEKRGNIITVSSMWGQVGASYEVAYATAKAGVIGFTKSLAKELAPSGIAVNCIAPGVIETDMISKLTEEDKLCLKEEIPLGRLGTGEEVAKTVAFLLGDCDYFTGQVLAPNGGIVM